MTLYIIKTRINKIVETLVKVARGLARPAEKRPFKIDMFAEKKSRKSNIRLGAKMETAQTMTTMDKCICGTLTEDNLFK